METLVSVVIPFYSHSEWLKEALDSVFEQSYNEIEVILINDGSIENIDSILEQYEGKIIYLYQENRGAAAARNMGIEIATGEYITFLDSDDLWTKDKIEVQLKYMVENNLCWSSTYYDFFGVNSQSNRIFGREKDGSIFPYPIISCHIATPSVMIKREILVNNSSFRFEESIATGEDSIFWLNLAKEYELGVVPQILAHVRSHGQNAARDLRRQLEFRQYVLEQMTTGKGIWCEVRLPVCSRIAYALFDKWKLLDLEKQHPKNATVLYNVIRGLFKIDRMWANAKKRGALKDAKEKE